MKKYFIFAASALALASCSSDDFLGENPGNVQNATNAINFSGDAGKITRATSNEGSTEKMLDGQFKVYGVKKTSETKLVSVFPDYSVWDVAEKNTTSNTDGWEYVGKEHDTNLGTGNIELKKDQTIKYWDYSASEYRFVAGSPIDAFTFKVPSDGFSKKIESATVSGLAGHIYANAAGEPLKTYPVYIADPVKVAKANYQKPVTFTFVRKQAMVRVGVYETIPGYFISNIKFYYYDTDGTTFKASDVNNIILTSATEGYFLGGTDISGTVTYDWTSETPSYTFGYQDTNLKKSKNWYAGKLDILATESTAQVDELYGSDKDMNTDNGYFTVLPTQVAVASPILIKCDYTLNAEDGSGETIEVTGATAAIPAAFSKWETNTRYTYLFKISQNTNGTTGNPENPDDKAGLYPITFAAVVTQTADKTQGSTTTVATPSITTYQAGSVTDKTIAYETGKPIYATVADEKTGTLNDLTTGGTTVGNVQVYKLSQERTEAELQVEAIANAEFIEAKKRPTEVPTTAYNNIEANKYLKFTPTEEGYYAIQYMTQAATTTDPAKPAAYTYKVVYVKAATTVVH